MLNQFSEHILTRPLTQLFGITDLLHYLSALELKVIHRWLYFLCQDYQSQSKLYGSIRRASIWSSKSAVDNHTTTTVFDCQFVLCEMWRELPFVLVSMHRISTKVLRIIKIFSGKYLCFTPPSFLQQNQNLKWSNWKLQSFRCYLVSMFCNLLDKLSIHSWCIFGSSVGHIFHTLLL